MTTLSTPIEYFKKEAKKLFRQVQANDAEAITRVQRVLNDPTNVSLMRVQHVVAIEYGFQKWEDLIGANPVELHLAITMEKVPLLNDFGIGIYDGHRRLSKEERDAIFKKDRKVLRESLNPIAKTIMWLQTRVAPIKTININQSSYRYKHIAEKDIGYITNGVFIAAAIIAGYPYKIANDGPNVLFGMSEKSIKETEKVHQSRSRGPNSTGTPLGNFFRGPGIIPTPPHLAALADMFDSMTVEDQRRYLDENARAMGLFNR